MNAEKVVSVHSLLPNAALVDEVAVVMGVVKVRCPSVAHHRRKRFVPVVVEANTILHGRDSVPIISYTRLGLKKDLILLLIID